MHGSQILAAVQNVAGVRWVEIERLQIAPALHPTLAAQGLLAPPPLLAPLAGFSARALGGLAAPGRRSLRAQADQLLSLAQGGLTIRFVADAEEASS